MGTLFAGRYRLESLLGSGSSGLVYEATHVWTGRPVALLTRYLLDRVGK